MNKTFVFGIGAIVIVGAGAYFFMGQNSPEEKMVTPTPEVIPANETATPAEPTNTAVTTPATSTPDATTPTPDVVSITVENEGMKFIPSTLTVKKGQTVRLTYKNTGGFHDWKIDEFNAATKQIQAGTEETIEFVADKAGSFEYYCSVGKHRAMGMWGTLTVTE